MNLIKKSRRLLILLCALMMSVSAFAFNFAGKTFKGSRTFGNAKIFATFRFMANNKGVGIIGGTGEKTQTHNIFWEVSGDFINYYDINGAPAYLRIDWEDEDGNELATPELVVLDAVGTEMITLKYTPSTATSSSKKKKRK